MLWENYQLFSTASVLVIQIHYIFQVIPGETVDIDLSNEPAVVGKSVKITPVPESGKTFTLLNLNTNVCKKYPGNIRKSCVRCK